MKVNTLTLLFLLLRNSLFGEEKGIPTSLTEQETVALLRLAEQQAISGLVADALTQNDVRMPKDYVFETIGLVENIKRQGRLVSSGVRELHKLFSENNIEYVIIKGQAVATYYPDGTLRQAGDIDYYCDLVNFPLSLSAIEKGWNIRAEKDGSEKHVHFEYGGILYEGHYSLTDFYSERRNDYFQLLLKKDGGTVVDIEGEIIRTLSPTLHVLFVFVHLYNHLLALGIGLRQFCDMAMMLNNAKDINLEKLSTHLQELGLKSAYCACGAVLVDKLGLPESKLGYTLSSKDYQYGKIILNVVLYRGNMGHYHKRGGFSGWRHKVESIGIKLSHFVKFMPLAPGYSCRWLVHEFARNI